MKLTIWSLVRRGAVAGAIAGAATGIFGAALTEGPLGRALQLEDAKTLGLPPEGAAMFGRGTQLLGGIAAAVILGVAMGVIFAVAFALLRHRIASRTEFGRAAGIAAAAFLATSLIPGLKYPSNPPTVGNPDTIGTRTGSYLLLLVTSVVLVYAVFHFWGWIGQRLDAAPRFLATAGLFAALVTIAYLVFPPSPDAVIAPDNQAAPALVVADSAPTPVLEGILATSRRLKTESIRDQRDPSQPLQLQSASAADLRGAPVRLSTAALVPHAYTTIVWQFRVASFGGILLMWALIATVFGWLVDRHVAL
ncbi:MAG TPA: CbtA family protein, partial [Mycobacterium sp.]|nr:CbtA family protein [Mycobacterium sp.]